MCIRDSFGVETKCEFPQGLKPNSPMVTARLKPCPFKASYHCGKPITGRDTASKGPYYPANASRNMADNSSALSTGGRQAKFVHTIATDGFAFNAGRLGMVSASTGGKF